MKHERVPEEIVLSAGERVAWAGVAVSRWSWVSGAVVAAVGTTGGLTAAAPYASSFWCLWVVAAILLSTAAVRVSINDRGVTVSSVVLPFVRRTFTVARIAGASGRWTDALADLGGWGPYRVMPGRHSVSLRTGDSLWLDLDGGREFVVTVDGAEEAAALVNALITRSGRHAGGGSGAGQD
ncbi:hypothetical protein [Streptomyces sp. NPDC060198]|uniref:hypothetical protein n=1 Tax=Streptomyces sp. NPDC060198 TaxID=3347070 RepID=UPI003649618A